VNSSRFNRSNGSQSLQSLLGLNRSSGSTHENKDVSLNDWTFETERSGGTVATSFFEVMTIDDSLA
jgi:hypothetical protein